MLESNKRDKRKARLAPPVTSIAYLAFKEAAPPGSYLVVK